MAYSAYAVANAFIQRANEGLIPNLTPMKLQKLLYFAQVWHIKGMEREPLLDDHFARWQFGPVIPAVYHEFKAYGSRQIDAMATTLAINGGDYCINVPTIPTEDENTWGLIDAIIHRYGGLSAQHLSSMTHVPNSAWSKEDADGSVITRQQMYEDTTVS